MTLNDFRPRRRDDSSDRYWRAEEPVVTPSGEFRPEMITAGDEPDPDEAMFARLERLVAFARENHREVFRLLHEAYLESAEDPEWMESVGVPTGLTQDQLAPYVGPVTLAVRRSSHYPSGYGCWLSTSPRWDEEHGLDFEFRDGELERIEY